MESSNDLLNNIYNNLSSVYSKDDGMINSNLAVILNAFAVQLQNIQDNIDQTKNNIYIKTADVDALEPNFGVLIDFKKPPKLNTITNGDEIYRSILQSLFAAYLNGSTELSMKTALQTVLSFLTTSTGTSSTILAKNYSYLNYYSNRVSLSWNAVSSGNTIATASDFQISPSGLTPVSYDDNSKILTFSGIPSTGVNYQFLYYIDNTNLSGTNWVNLTDENETSYDPMSIPYFSSDDNEYTVNSKINQALINTYNNPQFSYWWNNFNIDGSGVVIDEFNLNKDDSSLIWRLPEKTIVIPDINDNNNTITRCYEFYNNSGLSYDINVINESNEDTYFINTPTSYYDVDGNKNNYYITYSLNSNQFEPMTQFTGTFTGFRKYFSNISFYSTIDYGQLNFYYKNDTFDENDLFSTGTKYIWQNVDWSNGAYTLNNDYFYSRPFSLHEKTYFQENFETSNLSKFTFNDSNYLITDKLNDSIPDKENCLKIYNTGTNISIADANLNDLVKNNANRIEYDFYDTMNTGTTTSTFIELTGTNNNYYQFKLVADKNYFTNNNQVSLDVMRNNGFLDLNFNSLDDIQYGLYGTQRLNGSSFLTRTNNLPIQILTGNSYNNSQYSIKLSGTIIFNTDSILNQNANEIKIVFNNKANSTLNLQVDRYYSDRFTFNTYYVNSNVVHGHGGSYSISGFGGNGGTDLCPSITGLNTLIISKSGVYYNNNQITNFDALNNFAYYSGTALSKYIFTPFDSMAIRLTSNGNEIYSMSIGNNELRENFYNYGIGISPYYYQLSQNSNIDSASKHYLIDIPRSEGWKTISFDINPSHKDLNVYFQENNILNSGLSFITNINKVTFNHQSEDLINGNSYFDNIKISKYDKTQILPEYSGLYAISQSEEWIGNYLDQSTVLDNKTFKGSFSSNYQFNVIVKGIEEKFVYIIKTIIDKLKPAHTLTTAIFTTEQSLDTTEQSIDSNSETNWETGKSSNVEIVDEKSTALTNDLPGLIKIKGNS
jgi:hypothetical protein